MNRSVLIVALAGVLLLQLGVTTLVSAAEPLADCLPRARVAIKVHIGEQIVDAILEAGLEIPLTVLDRATGRLLWTGGESRTTTQTIAGMDSGFTGSLAVLDLDGDGLHDRLYAGDMAGRLWRFDMRHGSPASGWLAGAIHADFSNSEGRLFVAPADVSRATLDTSEPSLIIAVGTASPGNPHADNRFYVLRDPAPGFDWNLGSWEPLREHDLDPIPTSATVDGAPASITADAARGWFTRLGAGHVVAPSLTANRQLFLVVAETLPQWPARCEVFARLLALPLMQPGTVPLAITATLPPLREALPLSQGVYFSPAPGAALHCRAGTVRIEACDVDSRPVRTWWRREDAP